MSRIYKMNGVKVDAEKIKHCNLEELNEAIKADKDEIVTISEEDLNEAKFNSFWYGVGAGVIGSGALVWFASKMTKDSMKLQTKYRSELYRDMTRRKLEEKNKQ